MSALRKCTQRNLANCQIVIKSEQREKTRRLFPAKIPRKKVSAENETQEKCHQDFNLQNAGKIVNSSIVIR